MTPLSPRSVVKHRRKTALRAVLGVKRTFNDHLKNGQILGIFIKFC